MTLRSHTDVEKPEKNISIELSEPVALTFSLKYLVNFCKASGLSETVKLGLSNEVPLLVEYGMASSSWLRFYLAPKVYAHGSNIVVLLLTFSFRSATTSNEPKRKMVGFHWWPAATSSQSLPISVRFSRLDRSDCVYSI